MTSYVRGCRLIRVNALRSAIAIAAFVLAGSLPVQAQDAVSPVPEPAYAPSDLSAPADVAVPMPDSDPGGDGSIVKVPIPGGGTVTVEGPDLQNQPPHSPISTWGGEQRAQFRASYWPS
jgi:hypothetical protein